MNRKQRIALSMAALYVVSILGLALSLHFCGGRLANVELFSSEVSCKLCKDIPNEKKEDGCCNNTTVSVKVKDSHQISAKTLLPELFSIELFTIQPVIDLVQKNTVKLVSKSLNKAPPRSVWISLHIFNCIFRN